MNTLKIGVYICHCGGNISDYVDVEEVRAAATGEPGVAVAKTAMFTCSDATQQEIVTDIREHGLEGLVVASCSPKLHLFTFRETAKRAGLNPYQYTQVNLREQCSWAHRHNRRAATEKAIRLVRSGIARTKLTVPLEPLKIETTPAVLVVGAGVAGLRAAVGLADLGLNVYLLEKEAQPGGWVNRPGKMYPAGRTGKEIIAQLLAEVRKRKEITLFTGAELVEKSGSIGSFQVKVRVGEGRRQDISLNVGAVITATGFNPYRPAACEYGHGFAGAVTLPEYWNLLAAANGSLIYRGKEIKNVVYIYCVGSRQDPEKENTRSYCSRYCCNAAVYAALQTAEINPQIHQYHLYRDMRTYGKNELLFTRAREQGVRFLKFAGDNPPRVEEHADGRLQVTVGDLLTYGEEVQIRADLVVLVTGMVPRENEKLIQVLKLPLGKDGFFNEIHPKLRPVETVVGGVFICGAAQGPKNSAESVASALAAVTQSAALLKKGFVELEPLIAAVNPELCTWCAQCAKACPYAAIEQAQGEEKEVARVNRALCKGCGGCVPACPAGALDLQGYTDAQIRAMIDAFLKEAS